MGDLKNVTVLFIFKIDFRIKMDWTQSKPKPSKLQLNNTVEQFKIGATPQTEPQSFRINNGVHKADIRRFQRHFSNNIRQTHVKTETEQKTGNDMLTNTCTCIGYVCRHFCLRCYLFCLSPVLLMLSHAFESLLMPIFTNTCTPIRMRMSGSWSTSSHAHTN